MQDRYFGDVGDFGKYGLLRVLCGLWPEPCLKLGVVWYAFPNETHNADGKHTSYLQKNNPYFRECDEELYHKLRALIFDELGRLIAANRDLSNAAGLLPEGTVFYGEPLTFPVGLKREARDQIRNNWYASALATTAGTELVFLDPDKGIAGKIKRTANKGPKFVFFDEIAGFVHRGESVVVYHHLGRNGTHAQQVKGLEVEMRKQFPGREIFALRYRRGSGRAYFIIASPRHMDLLHQRLTKMLSGPWNRNFE